MPRIINCHVHTFTADHLPVDYLPFRLTRLLRNPIVRGAAERVLRLAGALLETEVLTRAGRFVRQAGQASQKLAFDRLILHYPPETVFVVLPMDFEYCGMQPPPVSVERQLAELAGLVVEYPGRILPFVPIHPERPDLLAFVRRWVEERGFRGLKLYPPLGADPRDSALHSVFAYAEERGLPVISHCAGVAVRSRRLSHGQALQLTAPLRCLEVLREFPRLKFCLAHYGGTTEWDKCLQLGLGAVADRQHSWVDDISKLLRDGGNQLYVDVSYTMWTAPSRYSYLKVLLEDPAIRPRVLFGSDYYMVDLERRSEKQVSVELRARLGEELWERISYTNSIEFLGAYGPPK
ncbi:MAG: amidohydrolase family protein [Armatimonadetes bacterium]|nr:amidohydrolase family protein [Armatimonadota bacterium]